MPSAQIELPPRLIPVFVDRPGEVVRYRGAYGGRGSAKTRSFALMTAIRGYQWGKAGREGIILCAREYMNSLDESSMEEVKGAIRSVPWLNAYYIIGETFIRSRDGRIAYAFAGLRQNVDSIKSKSRILLAWVDEAETVRESSWVKLIPTVREDDSEIWVTWNPESEDSATHKRFRKDPPEFSKIVEVNWQDNPWWPQVLELERLADQRLRPDDYPHIWEGAFRSRSKAQVFQNWRVGEVDVPERAVWRFGVDWGFATDPTAAVRCCLVDDRTLYITHEVYEHHAQTETLPALLMQMPGASEWVMRADSARPETIDYVRRHGFPKIRGARKGKGSVEDGIEFIRGLDVVIHPRCANTRREFRDYAFKVDKDTKEVLPVLEPGNDHIPDALRYALEGLHRKGRLLPVPEREERGLQRPRDYQRHDDTDDSDWKVA